VEEPPPPPPPPLQCSCLPVWPLQTPKAALRDTKVPAEQVRADEPKKLTTLHAEDVGAVRVVAISPDGKTLASAGRHLVELWDIDQNATKPRAALTDPKRPSLFQPVPTHDGFVWAVAFSPDGKTLATGAGGVWSPTPGGGKKMGKVEGEVRLWDVATGKEKALPQRSGMTVYSLAFSPDGKTLAWGGGIDPREVDTTYREGFEDIPKEYLNNFKEFGEVTVLDLATRKERTFFRGDAGRINSVAFSPDGKTLASGGRDGAIRLFDVAKGKERACLREHGRGNAKTGKGRPEDIGLGGVYAVAFSPDGKTLAAVPDYSPFRIPTRGESVKLWDLATRRVRAHLEAPAVWVWAVAFSADSRTVTTTGEVLPRGQVRGEVRLWDAASGKPRCTPMRVDHDAHSVAIGVCGKKKILASAGEGRRPWEEKDRKWRGHPPGEPIMTGKITLWELDPPGDKAP